MAEMKASTSGGLRVDATDGQVQFAMDEPVDKGGTGAGPTPMQTMLSALAGCTAITLKMYSARKNWPLEDVKVRVALALPEKGAEDQTKRITQHVELIGPLDDEQRERLLQISGRCPVHRVMEGPIAFEERFAEGD